MSPRPGIPNNPTGKGGFKSGENGWSQYRGSEISAAKRMIVALEKAAMAQDGALMEKICADIVQEACDGDKESRVFLFNRIVGMPKASVAISDADQSHEHDALAEKLNTLLDGMAQRKSGETVQ